MGCLDCGDTKNFKIIVPLMSVYNAGGPSPKHHLLQNTGGIVTACVNLENLSDITKTKWTCNVHANPLKWIHRLWNKLKWCLCVPCYFFIFHV